MKCFHVTRMKYQPGFRAVEQFTWYGLFEDSCRLIALQTVAHANDNIAAYSIALYGPKGEVISSQSIRNPTSSQMADLGSQLHACLEKFGVTELEPVFLPTTSSSEWKRA